MITAIGSSMYAITERAPRMAFSAARCSHFHARGSDATGAPPQERGGGGLGLHQASSASSPISASEPAKRM